MSTRYWTRVARELWDRRDQWPPVDGWRLTGETRVPTIGYGTLDGFVDFAVEAEAEDDHEAATNLVGRLVDVTFQQTPEGVRVMERRPIR